MSDPGKWSTANPAMGVSGRIAGYFQSAQITPLLALLALLQGIFAVMVTPREEEPQNNVTMAHGLIPFPGAAVRDVRQRVAAPAEQVLSRISGVEPQMSVSRPGLAVTTVQSKVGVPRTVAPARLHDTVNSNADRPPTRRRSTPPERTAWRPRSRRLSSGFSARCSTSGTASATAACRGGAAPC